MRRRWGRLIDHGNRMQRLNFEPVEPVESNIMEIRHLSATLERMRAALQTFSRRARRPARGAIDSQDAAAGVLAHPGQLVYQRLARAVGACGRRILRRRHPAWRRR